jgi:hypothetical protein
MLMEPGPGVGGPGPGIMTYETTPPATGQTSQIVFVGPEGMMVSWDVSMPGQFDSEPLICPGRYNFPQAAIYRLRLSNIPGRPGIELYPTLEVGPAMPRTEAFLAHNAIPVQATEEDLDQVLSGNFVTKVIYLPDPDFQDLALAGVETLVSTRLDPGVDPIIEADRRGAILAIFRLGNKDLEIPSDLIGQIDQGVVMPASYNEMGAGPACPETIYDGPACPETVYGGQAYGGSSTPLGMPVGQPSTIPSHYIAGVTGPQYGMPISGTPIGLPGPPHVPLGIPAGLEKHVIKNHTHMHIPGPTKNVKVHVRQDPGFSYPKPANRAYIVEQTRPGLGVNCQPWSNKCQVTAPDCGGCGQCVECGECQW